VAEKIDELKARQDAVILAHNYQRPEIQDIADFVGDSLDLSRKAAEVGESVIVFCGVDFMAETAAILSPEKTVILPDLEATCPMAAMLPAEKVRQAKAANPGVPVVLYVNTLAEAKAEADICCTSANAAAVVNSLDADTVLFGPDKNLAHYVMKNTDKTIIPIPDDGYCLVHKNLLTLEKIQKLKSEHPGAVIMVHPECEPEVQDAADLILSTGGMVRAAREQDAAEFIVGTEEGLAYRLAKENPDKKFFPVESAVCVNMKRHALDKVTASLQTLQPRVQVPKEIADKARTAIQRMLDLTARD